MAITVNIYYTGKNGSAKEFVNEMIQSGTVKKIKEEQGNIKYDYFISFSDPETILLIDSWKSQNDIDIHHKSEMMKTIISLREKYDLHMKVERYTDDDTMPEKDRSFIRE